VGVTVASRSRAVALSVTSVARGAPPLARPGAAAAPDPPRGPTTATGTVVVPE
jgi:hypothetical protein